MRHSGSAESFEILIQPMHRVFAAFTAAAVCLGLANWRLASPPANPRVQSNAGGVAANVARVISPPSGRAAPAASNAGGASTLMAPDHAERQALIRALSVDDPLQQGEELVRALRVWGATDAHGAGTWAAAQTAIDPTRAVAAVVNGAVAANRAEEAERFVLQLAANDSARAHDYRGALIYALGDAGLHERAAAFAAGGSGQAALPGLTLAYSAWARRDPEAAMISAAELDDVTRQRTAFQASATVWARTDPTRLADCALHFPAGPERDFALVAALRTWSAKEPAASTAWMRTHRDVISRLNGLQLVLED